MPDGPTIATLILILALFKAFRVFSMLSQRSLHAAGRALLSAHLAHWHYPPGAWRAYCERERGEIWNRYLRPAPRYLLPAALLVGGIAWVAEQRAGLSGGVASLVTLTLALLAANTILGPSPRSFIRMSRRRGLDYELYLGASGALEIWREGGEMRDAEEHLFKASGSRIELVEADGVDPAEIVFSLARPLGLGIQHTEARFLVPEGRLADARALARSLTPEEPAASAP